jgi:hypothetical protein
MPVLANDILRLNTHLAEMVAFHYSFGIHSPQAHNIQNVLKRGAAENGFRHLMKYPQAAQQLSNVLKLGGVWSSQYDAAYATLWKCRVGEVSK